MPDSLDVLMSSLTAAAVGCSCVLLWQLWLSAIGYGGRRQLVCVALRALSSLPLPLVLQVILVIGDVDGDIGTDDDVSDLD